MKTMAADVTPGVLFWARESAGCSREEIVAKIKQKKVTVETLRAWETGEKKPSYPQFEKPAGYYKRPLALFFLPEPPREEPLERKFRSLPGSYIDRLSSGIRLIVRMARVRQLNLMELHDETPPPGLGRLTALRAGRARGIPRLARAARELLGVPLDVQKEWGGAEIALKRWRDALESLGLWVFKDPFKGEDAYDGFYLADESFPVVYLNNGKSKARQIFTLFHELGHFLLSKGGICFRDDMERELEGSFNRDEVFCNAFAGEFLVPAADLELSRMPGDEEIRRHADAYKVSREVILRKCLDKGLIGWQGYNQRKENRAENFKKRTGGGNPYLNRKAYLGTKYLELAFSKYYQKNISEFQLADYLGVKADGIPGMEAVMYQGRDG